MKRPCFERPCFEMTANMTGDWKQSFGQDQNENPETVANRYHFGQFLIALNHKEILHDQIREYIIKGNEFEPKESILCNWCYYWEECPAKSSLNY